MPTPDTASLEALREGICGDGVLSHREYDIIVEMARQVVRRFPDVKGVLDDTEPATALVSELFADDQNLQRVTHICALADDPNEFGRLMYRVLQSVVVDHFRRTERGALHRRLQRLLEQAADMERIPKDQPYGGSWRLVGSTGEWNGSEEPLHSAAARFSFATLEWNSERRSPRIGDTDLTQLVRIILETAGGPVSVSAISRVCSERIGIGLVPTFLELDDRDMTDLGRPDDPTEDSVRKTAETVFGSLSADEVIDLSVYHLTTRKAADVLGVSKSTAAVRRRRLERTVADLLGPGADRLGELVVLAVIEAGQDSEVRR